MNADTETLLDKIDDELFHIEADIVALRKLLDPPAPSNLLVVPWIGQNVSTVSTDDWSNSDCGPACVAMWLGYVGKSVTVDQVSQSAGLPRGYRYTVPADLILAAGKFGLSLKRVTGLTPIYIKSEIDNKRPLIVLVHYGSLLKRYDPNYKAGHFLVITGYDADNVIYNDPYWQDATGMGIHLGWLELNQAMADCMLDGNTAYQGLAAA